MEHWLSDSLQIARFHLWGPHNPSSLDGLHQTKWPMYIRPPWVALGFFLLIWIITGLLSDLPEKFLHISGVDCLKNATTWIPTQSKRFFLNIVVSRRQPFKFGTTRKDMDQRLAQKLLCQASKEKTLDWVKRSVTVKQVDIPSQRIEHPLSLTTAELILTLERIQNQCQQVQEQKEVGEVAGKEQWYVAFILSRTKPGNHRLCFGSSIPDKTLLVWEHYLFSKKQHT